MKEVGYISSNASLEAFTVSFGLQNSFIHVILTITSEHANYSYADLDTALSDNLYRQCITLCQGLFNDPDGHLYLPCLYGGCRHIRHVY